MAHLLPSAQPDWTHCLTEVSAYGQLDVPAFNCQLAFEVDIVPRACPDQIYFGLVCFDAQGHSPRAGFAVRLDLHRGEVWDVLNGGGLLGHLETGPLGLERYDEDESLLLSLRVGKLGGNLLPELRIGDQLFLYPAIATQEGTRFSAITGAFQPGRDAAPFCHFPALWMTAAAH